MTRAAAFLEKSKRAGLYAHLSRNGIQVNGEGRAAEAARKALESIPSLADEVKALLRPSDEDMRTWLAGQDEAIQTEFTARIERLTAAGVQGAERVALRTTWLNWNSFLPERLRPVSGRGCNPNEAVNRRNENLPD